MTGLKEPLLLVLEGKYTILTRFITNLYTYAPYLISPVGSGKTALMLALCQRLREEYSLAAVTNDIFTKEDTEFLVRNAALPEDRIAAIETGGCPHAVSFFRFKKKVYI